MGNGDFRSNLVDSLLCEANCICTEHQTKIPRHEIRNQQDVYSPNIHDNDHFKPHYNYP